MDNIRRIISNIKQDDDVATDMLATFLSSSLHVFKLKELKEIVLLLLNKGANLNGISIYDKTPFHCYFTFNKNVTIKVIKFLIYHGGDIDSVHRCGDTVLHKYLGNENIDYKVVEFLIRKGFDVCKLNNSLKNPIHIFTIRHINNINLNILNLLCSHIKHEYNKNDEMMSILNTMLNYCNDDSTCFSAIKYIIDITTINYRDKLGYSPVMYASTADKTILVDYLIKLGANMNITTNDGNTCGSFAVMNCNGDINRLFLNQNPNIETIDNTLKILSENIVFIDGCDVRTNMVKKILMYGFTLDPLFYKNHDIIVEYFSSSIKKYNKIILQMIDEKIGNRSVYDIIFTKSNTGMDIRYVCNDIIIKYASVKYYGSLIKRLIYHSKKRKRNILKAIHAMENNATLWNYLPLEVKMYIMDFLPDTDITNILFMKK
uniref:Ankyrin repeat protein n=1 Tax=Swinepox virus TaxID=10276 RepID=A0A068ETI4_SWPV|nr:ankyrin repeat protein [Swinepox virus]